MAGKIQYLQKNGNMNTYKFLIIVTGGLKALENNVPSSSLLLKKILSAEVKNQGAL